MDKAQSNWWLDTKVYYIMIVLYNGSQYKIHNITNDQKRINNKVYSTKITKVAQFRPPNKTIKTNQRTEPQKQARKCIHINKQYGIQRRKSKEENTNK